MRRLILLTLLLTGCQRAVETPITSTTSSDGWSLAVSSRSGGLRVGTNDVVLSVTTDMHAAVVPGDVQAKLLVKAAHPSPSATPPGIELQPDGEPGHWLAIFDMAHPDTWNCELSMTYKNVPQVFHFDLKN